MKIFLRILITSYILFFIFYPTITRADCTTPSSVQAPDLYSVGWLPWLADLKSWRNYNPKEIQNIGRLIPSSSGGMVGEPLAGNPTCNILSPGEYTYVMKWQDNETQSDYIGNTDIIYLQQPIVPGPDYIRHSQLASGLPVFCAGTFRVDSRWWPFNDILGEVNEVVEVTNFSGHFKPQCKCLGVVASKLAALGVDTSGVTYKFMGEPKTCQ
ncbi:hypothetical protein [Chromobacterium vaccinii]|uniref:hypothetical protein n=1 Tax=Chromobacterium vaccinii TaxID=1108595 RepID=UPI003260B230